MKEGESYFLSRWKLKPFKERSTTLNPIGFTQNDKGNPFVEAIGYFNSFNSIFGDDNEEIIKKYLKKHDLIHRLITNTSQKSHKIAQAFIDSLWNIEKNHSKNKVIIVYPSISTKRLSTNICFSDRTADDLSLFELDNITRVKVDSVSSESFSCSILAMTSHTKEKKLKWLSLTEFEIDKEHFKIILDNNEELIVNLNDISIPHAKQNGIEYFEAIIKSQNKILLSIFNDENKTFSGMFDRKLIKNRSLHFEPSDIQKIRLYILLKGAPMVIINWQATVHLKEITTFKT